MSIQVKAHEINTPMLINQIAIILHLFCMCASFKCCLCRVCTISYLVQISSFKVIDVCVLLSLCIVGKHLCIGNPFCATPFLVRIYQFTSKINVGCTFESELSSQT